MTTDTKLDGRVLTREQIEARIALLEGDHVMLDNPFTRAELLATYRLALRGIESGAVRQVAGDTATAVASTAAQGQTKGPEAAPFSDLRDPEAVRHSVSFETWLSYQPWIAEGGAKLYSADTVRAAWNAGATALPPLRSTEQEWVMAPREPTEAMVEAAFVGFTWPQDFGARYQKKDYDEAKRIYRAMLAAAPSANAGK